MSDAKKSPRDSFLYAFGVYGGVGFQLAVAVIGGILGGRWLDDKLGTEPALLIVGLLLGTTAGFYNLYRILLRRPEASEADHDSPSDKSINS